MYHWSWHPYLWKQATLCQWMPVLLGVAFYGSYRFAHRGRHSASRLLWSTGLRAGRCTTAAQYPGVLLPPLGMKRDPPQTEWNALHRTVVKRLSNCQHRRSQGSWHEWDEHIWHFDAFFMFIGIIGFEVVHICGTCLISWGFNSFKGPPTGKLITQCCTTLWDCPAIMFVIPCWLQGPKTCEYQQVSSSYWKP